MEAIPWIDARLIMRRIENIERLIIEKHPKARSDPHLAAEIRSLREDSGLPWESSR